MTISHGEAMSHGAFLTDTLNGGVPRTELLP